MSLESNGSDDSEYFGNHKKLPEAKIAPVKEEIDSFLNKEQSKLAETALESLRIEKEMMINLKSDEASAAEQFLCILCGNMVIPKFNLSADHGIDYKSIKIP